MTLRKKQNTAMSNQPVRFYKVVALSFLLLTIVLLGVITFMSSKRATITVITRPEPVDVSTSIKIGGEGQSTGILTTTIVELSKEFNPAKTKDKPGIATGVATIHNETNFDQPLVATTRLLTPEGIMFRLKEKVLVPAKGSVEAEVYADEGGAGSDIGPSKFTIPGLNEVKQKVVYATSETVMKGGVAKVGVVTSDDITKAEKEILQAVKDAGQAELAEAYPGKGSVYEIIQYVIDTDKEIGDEGEEFILTAKATILGVFFDLKEASEAAAKGLGKRVISDVELVSTDNISPSVTLEDYDLEENIAVLKVFCNGLVELNPESRQLDKLIFFGKTKDEIRRYLLSLDHVHGVEIKFSPAWMHTVPHVAEHVNIVVKKVE